MDDNSNKVRFSKLSPDGIESDIREVKRTDILACPFVIMVAEHYREDGSCKCDDPIEQKKMIKEWGYTKKEILAGLKKRGRNV